MAGRLGDVGLVPAGWQFGQADQRVEAEVLLEQVFEMAAFDDLDPAAVACSEVPAGLAHPGRGNQDALGRVLAVSLRLDDAQPADDRVLVYRDRRSNFSTDSTGSRS